MAETSGFFEAELNEETGQWDREYFAHQFASYFKLFFGNGVFGSPTNQLKVLAGDGLKVIVKAGWAFIEGYWYFNEADLELTIDPNTTAFDRQDSIMCRLDMASKKITSVALAGVTDVVRDGNYYDLKLASVIVGVAGTSISNANIVDTRTDQTVCGLVTGVMKVQPTADLFAQFTAQFNLWFETIKGQLSGDVAGNLQNQIGSLPDLETSVKSSLVEAINELTQKEVDVLDTYEEIMANTTPGKAAGGVGVKQGFIQLNDSLIKFMEYMGYNPNMIYLYNKGDEYEAITGGWVASTDRTKFGLSNTYSAGVSIKNTNNLYFGDNASAYAVGGVYTANSVDLTNFNTLVLNYDTSNSGNDGLFFAVKLGDATIYETLNEKVTNKTVNIDISSYVGSHIIKLYAGAGGSPEYTYVATVRSISLA